MILKSDEGRIMILILTESPLVDDLRVSGVVEERGRYPWLEIASSVNSDLESEHRRQTSSTSHPPKLTPRIFWDS